ncbi:hypothetical protein DSW25_12550 [Sulfitobacter donghicola DSW-25 = KCTC 12864 = JCM 14565]|uniref:Uncharacterized protein n=1 Tax=Sulfitobacter donghicola DSW-25 = KCTC 12864 = JCM 14565 TaxID=1300350 RepID=A0A073II30_9RHOB|nr:hypothetical protein DSW25_12550 [Sulfitobacter donghicola DSW-25 = KCTC 12864 = JCM 14565]
MWARSSNNIAALSEQRAPLEGFAKDILSRAKRKQFG